MNNLWNHFKTLFQQSEQSSSSNPFIHEVIERSASEKDAYKQWSLSADSKYLTNWVFRQYGLYKALPNENNDAITFLKTNSTNGFAIYVERTDFAAKEFTYFMDWLKEKVQGLNYRVQISDTRTYSKGKFMETTARHYLKPRIQFQEGEKINQRFGNITIELVSKDNHIKLCKFIATYYSDHLYDEAETFEILMEEIFS